jgi:hypothetical protein
MRVSKLQDKKLITDEEDLPIIYDIVRKKLEAGELVLHPAEGPNNRSRYLGLSTKSADPEEDVNELSVVLEWVAQVKQNGVWFSDKNITLFRPDELSTWKLVKEPTYWKLDLI